MVEGERNPLIKGSGPTYNGEVTAQSDAHRRKWKVLSWREPTTETPPRDAGSWVSKINYSYINPLLALGWTKPLNADDLPPLAENDKTRTQHRKLREAWDRVQGTGSPTWRFWRALYHAFTSEFYLAAIYSVLESALTIGQPVLLGYLLTWFKDDDDDYLKGGLFTGGFITCSFLAAIVHHQLFYHTMRAGWVCRMGCTALIHEKLLHSSYSARQSHTNGKIINLVSTDVLRFDMGMVFLQFTWVSAIDCIVVYYLMARNVGYGPAAAGVGVLALVSIWQLHNTKRLARFRKETAQATDARVSLTSQLLSGMLSVKAATWEVPFQKMIAKLRANEARWILKSQLVKAFNLGIYFSAPAVASFVTFALYVHVNGHQLEIDEAYPTIALLQVLRHSMGKKLARAFETVPEMHIAVKRIQDFLETEEDGGVADHEEPAEEGLVLEVDSMSCQWNTKKTVVEGLSLKVGRGEMVSISGPVGCGKSTVLSAILGEAKVTSGSIKVRGPVAYCPQQPWIIAGTVRDNILFGSEYDAERYERILKAACIDVDIKQLQNGDMTEIGERGVNLSGGQKARVSLARALYSDAQLILLDDPLAAVDPCVCDSLLDSMRSLLTYKEVGILLVSHQPKAVVYSERVVSLTATGTVAYYGEPEESAMTTSPQLSKSSSVEEVPEKPEGGSGEAPVKLVEAEDRMKGAVTGQTYKSYFQAGGTWLTVVVAVCLVAGQGSMMYSDYFLSNWAGNDLKEQQKDFYLIVYGSACGMTFVLGLVRAFLFFYITIRANSNIHNGSFASVLHTHMSFFTSNPLGRIINRFSADLGQIDEQLPVSFFDTLQMACMVVGAVVLVCIAIPWIIIAIPFLVAIFWWLRKYATRSLRELKRLDGISRSPVFAAFSANLNGITSIKAFQKHDEIQHAFGTKLEKMALPWYWWFIGNRWIGFRLDIMCSFLVLFLAGFGLALRDSVSTSLYALAMTYSMTLGEMFQYMVRQSSLVETMMTSVERLLYYRDRLEPEAGLDIPTIDPEWPADGSLALNNLAVRYRKDLPLVLTDVSAAIPQGSRVGVVGRTGSGKSSLFQALLGLNNVEAGEVLIAGKNARIMPLTQRRKAVTLIPQEPVLFTGTVRYNLDPFEMCGDAELWDVLEKVQLKGEIRSLDDKIAEGGSNLSTGHRQLFSLARSMLNKARIVLVDEATANVDFKTDRIIQQTIRTAEVFKAATIITIAHRMETIADSTHIMALDKGRLVEFGSPAELLKEENGLYRNMVATAETKQ